MLKVLLSFLLNGDFVMSDYYDIKREMMEPFFYVLNILPWSGFWSSGVPKMVAMTRRDLPLFSIEK